MPVPTASTIATALPDRVVAPGYMWMSGTSFAAPVVAGAAAQLLARHPSWTPDQVKGALMLTAAYLPNARWRSRRRRGRRCLAAAPAVHAAEPEREPLRLRVDRPDDRPPTFDQAAWASTVSTEAAWASAAWASAAWASAAWGSAAWGSAAWSSSTFSASTSSLMSGLVTYGEATYAP